MQRWLPQHHPDPRFHPRSRCSGSATRVRWLGTAGHVVQTETTTILLDPFLSRPGLLRTALRRLRPRADAWWHWLPDRVDAICCGHSHYDHVLDAPEIALRTGATLIGSRTTLAFGRAHGVPEEQLVLVPATGIVRRIGDVDVRFVPSRHGRILVGRVPFPGEVQRARLPARVFHYRMGGAFGIHLTTPQTSLYHNGSADLIDAELEGLHADVLLAGLAGRQATPGYLERMMEHLEPNWVVPTHHDAFFAPLESGVRLLPGIDLRGFVEDVRRHGPHAQVRMPTYESTLLIDDDSAGFVHL